MAQQPNQNISMEQIMAFATTPAGKQLLSMLQARGGDDLNRATSLAAAGNMEEAKKSLSSLLSDPQIRNLLKQYGG